MQFRGLAVYKQINNNYGLCVHQCAELHLAGYTQLHELFRNQVTMTLLRGHAAPLQVLNLKTSQGMQFHESSPPPAPPPPSPSPAQPPPPHPNHLHTTRKTTKTPAIKNPSHLQSPLRPPQSPSPLLAAAQSEPPPPHPQHHYPRRTVPEEQSKQLAPLASSPPTTLKPTCEPHKQNATGLAATTTTRTPAPTIPPHDWLTPESRMGGCRQG